MSFLDEKKLVSGSAILFGCFLTPDGFNTLLKEVDPNGLGYDAKLDLGSIDHVKFGPDLDPGEFYVEDSFDGYVLQVYYSGSSRIVVQLPTPNNVWNGDSDDRYVEISAGSVEIIFTNVDYSNSVRVKSVSNQDDSSVVLPPRSAIKCNPNLSVTNWSWITLPVVNYNDIRCGREKLVTS